MERRGYLHRNQRNGRFLLGSKLLQFANTAIAGLELRERAEPVMRALARSARLPVQLGIVDGHNAVVIAGVDAPAPRCAGDSSVGRRIELHCTALGKALLAGWSDSDLARLARTGSLPRHNDNTIWTLRRLSEEMTRIRRLGYAVEDEENAIGFRSIGAPVYSNDGSVMAAVSVGGSTAEITPEILGWVAAEVRQAAWRLTAEWRRSGGAAVSET
jgi:DNA-binding IclR family transcriptional regulator